MTVSTSYAPLSFNGDDATTAFAVTWPFFDSSLVVTLVDSTGVETVKTITTHYTVSGGTDSDGLPATGTVTMLTAPASGETLRITRNTSKVQSSSWTNGGAYQAKTLEATLDKIILIAQETQAGINDDITGDVMQLNTSGATDYWDAEDQIILNVGTSTTPDAAVNYQQLADAVLAAGNWLGTTGATDNALLRADGTGGATLQASPVAISDDGDITGANSIDIALVHPVADRTALKALNTSVYTTAYLDGRLWSWSDADVSGTLLGSGVASTAVSSATDTIEVSGGHDFYDGDAIVVNLNTNGLTTNTIYYAIRVSGTELQLAASWSDAMSATQVNITSSNNITMYQHCDPLEAMYVTPSSDVSGASGSWVLMTSDNRYSIDLWRAAGDGSTDDTHSINAAFNLINAIGGGVLVLLDATYLSNYPIRMRNNVSVDGSGWVSSVIDSRSATKSIYASEKCFYVCYKNFGITHSNNSNTNVDGVRWEAGLSRAFVGFQFTGREGYTQNGIVNYGVNPNTATANNNQYGVIWECRTTSDGEVSGIALWLQSDNTLNSRQNAHVINGGCVIDGFSTGIKLNGNGNLFENVTFNGPASTAALHLHGDGCYGNTIINPYIDSAVTGAWIKLETDTDLNHMVTVIDAVLNFTKAKITDSSGGGRVARYTLFSRNQLHIAMGTLASSLSKASNNTSLVAVGADDDVGVFGIASATGGGFAVSGSSYSGGITGVSNNGGASAIINDNSSAEFRLVKTANGTSYTKLLAVTNAGAVRNLQTSNGPVGTFTLGAAATTVVSNTSVTGSSIIQIFPTNAAAATLMSGASSLYISARTASTSFTVATADGASASGTETFNYILLN